MQTYTERSIQVVQDASIVAMVLMNESNTDIELCMLHPQQSTFPEREEFVARKLRSVGVIALCGTQPRAALKEPLDNPVVDAIAAAFLEYLRVLIGESLTAQMEIAALEHIYSLPDTRPN